MVQLQSKKRTFGGRTRRVCVVITDWRERLDDEDLRRAEEAEEAARLEQERRLAGVGAVRPDEGLAKEGVAGDSKDGAEPVSQDDLSPGAKRRRVFRLFGAPVA